MDSAPHNERPLYLARLLLRRAVDDRDRRPVRLSRWWKAAIPGTSSVFPHLRTLVEAFRRAGRPIVHIVRLYEEADGQNVDLCPAGVPRRRHSDRGDRIAPGAELAADLAPEGAQWLDADLLLAGGLQRLGPEEVVLYKPRWSAFYGTPLEGHLRDGGVSSLVVAGCNFSNWPRPPWSTRAVAASALPW